MFRPSHRQFSVRVVFGAGCDVQWDDMWCTTTNSVFGYGDGGPSKWGSLDLVGLPNTVSTVVFHACRKWSRCGTQTLQSGFAKKFGNLSTWPQKYPFCTPQQTHFLEKDTAPCRFLTHIVAAAILDAIWCSHAPHGSAFGVILRCSVDPEVVGISKKILAETGHVPCPEANVKFLTCAL